MARKKADPAVLYNNARKIENASHSSSPVLDADVKDVNWTFMDKNFAPVGKTNRIVEDIKISARGDWGFYDGEKIAKAAEKAAMRELNRQARERINNRIAKELGRS